MSRIQIVLFYSMNGRNVHQKNSISMLFEGSATHNSSGAKATANQLKDALSRVLPENLHWLSAKATELDADGNQLAGKSKSFALTGTGLWEPGVGVELAPASHVINLQKDADDGRAGITPLRYALSTAELKAYYDAGTIPARLTTASIVNGSPSQTLEQAVKYAGTGNNLQLSMPETYQGVHFPTRLVTSVTIKDIGENQPTRQKGSADANYKAAIQAKINKLVRAGKASKKNDPNGDGTWDPTDVAHAAVKAAFHDLYDDLDPVLKASLKVDPILYRATPAQPPV